MNLIKRLKNLWRLSEIELKRGEISLAQFHNIVDKVNKIEKPKMAQIIKRNNPVEDFLTKNE